MIAVIDYGAGNLRSVTNAINRLGYQPVVTGNPADLAEADAAILPGVGAAADAMSGLRESGMLEPLCQFVKQDRPLLGICLGLQILFTFSEEDGRQECLDILPGRVKRLPPGLKTPHMGWNQVKQKKSHPVFKGIPDGANFYFVHSYFAEQDDSSIVAGETEYGIKMCSVIIKGNLIGVQFHPEKSGELGLKLFDNFIRLAMTKK